MGTPVDGVLFGWGKALDCVLEKPVADHVPGRRLRFDDFPSTHIHPRRVEIWLPPGYAETGPACRVLYVPEGQNIFHDPEKPEGGLGVDRVLGRLILEGLLPPTIVVAIWAGEHRAREFLPDEPFRTVSAETQSDYESLIGGGPLCTRFGDFLVSELKPFIDSHLRTRTDPAGNLLFGVSMAALANLYTLVRYPDIFGGAACVSTHWLHVSYLPWIRTGDLRMSVIAAAFLRHLSQHLPAAGRHRFYFDLGTAGLDAVNPTLQEFVDRVLGERGYRQNVDWLTRIFPDETHTPRAWRQRIDIPLRFILGH